MRGENFQTQISSIVLEQKSSDSDVRKIDGGFLPGQGRTTKQMGMNEGLNGGKVRGEICPDWPPPVKNLASFASDDRRWFRFHEFVADKRVESV